MRHNRLVSVLGAGAVLTVIMAGCAAPTGSSPTGSEEPIDEIEPISLIWEDLYSPESAYGKAAVNVFDYVERETNGKVTFEPYFSGSLLAAPELLSGLGSGLTDVGGPTPILFPNDLPIANWAGILPALLPDDPVEASLLMPLVHTELYQASEDLQKEFVRNGVRPTVFISNTSTNMYCTESVDGVGGAEGFRVRAAGEPTATIFTSVGMVPVQVAAGEVYEALQRGVIDCASASNALVFFGNQGVAEVAPYFYKTSSPGVFGGGRHFNLERWESLPAGVQEILDAALAQWVADLTRFDSEANAAAAANPVVQFGDASVINATMKDTIQTLLENAVASAPAEVSDPEAMIQLYRDLVAKWQPRVKAMISGASGTGSPQDIRQRLIDAPASVDWDAFAEALREAQQAGR